MLFLYIRLPVKKPTPIHRRVVRLRYTYKKKAAHFHKLCDTGKKPLWYTVYDRIKFVQNMTLTLGSVFKGVLSVVKQFFFGGGVIWYICRGSYDIYVEYVAFCVFPHYVISGMGGILCGKQGKNFFRRKKSEVFFVKITF